MKNLTVLISQKTEKASNVIEQFMRELFYLNSKLIITDDEECEKLWQIYKNQEGKFFRSNYPCASNQP